jgi:succinate dehydrogenase / fumarate reductase cytochrome b subunit
MTEGNPERGRKAGRPLSPHIMIYTPQINMIMSILHRLTGAALYVGTLLLAWWLVAAASGPDAYAQVSAVLGSWPGLVVLFGYTWALINHMLGGVRHFIWDTGRGFALGDIDLLCWGSLAASALITAAIWGYALWTTVGTGS